MINVAEGKEIASARHFTKIYLKLLRKACLLFAPSIVCNPIPPFIAIFLWNLSRQRKNKKIRKRRIVLQHSFVSEHNG